MDVVKEKQKRVFSRTHKLLIATVVIAAIVLWQFQQPASSQKLQRKDVLFGQVQQGDLSIQVEGYGTLESSKQKRLTALTRATVDEIFLKPGSAVTPDSTIMILNNPELLQALESAGQDLSQQKANLRMLRLNQRRDLITEENQLVELRAKYKEVSMRRKAEETLFKKGIISRIVFKTTQLQEQQLKERIKLLQKRREQLFEVHKEAVNIQQEKIKQSQSLYEIAGVRVDQLKVKADVAGVLQELPVVVGQSVAPGETLAVAGSTTDLLAKIRITQTRAGRIQTGQQVVIDTRRDKVEGKVVRIDPKVVDGTVSVEVAFTDRLPDNARPALSVSASIIIDNIESTLYIERPVNVAENSQLELFKLDEDMTTARIETIGFGVESGRYIQLVSGATIGESLILSDLSRTVSADNIVIVD